jgi:hypothetical protein
MFDVSDNDDDDDVNDDDDGSFFGGIRVLECAGMLARTLLGRY